MVLNLGRPWLLIILNRDRCRDLLGGQLTNFFASAAIN